MRGGGYYGRTIRKPEYEKNIFIIVCSERYYEIRKQLLEMGYSEFNDFVPYRIFNKKMAIAYGNCHMGAVKQYLERNKGLASDYGFYPFPAIQYMETLDNYQKVLPYCDLFIHQSIRETNKFGAEYASNSMIDYLSKKCKVLSIPNLYGMPDCFFPQQSAGGTKGWGCFCHFFAGEEENVKKWLEMGKTEEDIKEYMLHGGVYHKKEIQEKWNEFKTKLLQREKEWDIKISDYIFDNYKYKKLFYEKFHISDILVKEIASRILNHLGYNGEIPYTLSPLDNNEMFIYQDVMDALDLKFEQKYIRLHHRDYSLTLVDMDIDQYVYQLCKCIIRSENDD